MNLAEAVPAFRHGPGALLRHPFERLLGLDEVNAFLQELGPNSPPEEIFQRAMDILNLRYRITRGALEQIPTSGPLIVVANHPFGGADALVLSHLLMRQRPDMKMLANHVLGRLESLRPWVILVDPFASGEVSMRRNLGPLRESLAHLRAGACLGMFPAGEVSAFSPESGHVRDKIWSDHLGALVRKTGATVVPVCFEGANSLVFQTAGMVHPLLRTALLPREFMRWQGKELRLAIGRPMRASDLPVASGDHAVVAAIRQRVDLMGSECENVQHVRPAVKPPAWFKTPPKALIEKLATPVDKTALAAEIARLPASSLLASQSGLEVRIATASQIPLGLLELGRLRELTFREVGEGTGKSRDLDNFDQTYRHLFLWNPEHQEIAGAYRLGLGDDLVKRFGRGGFYTHTLFHFSPAFLRRLGPCLEMGRSFVVPAYQRKPHSLFLLWKGIGAFVARNPQYRMLFGPVSISREYSNASRSLLVEFLQRHHGAPEMGRYVRARHPFRPSARMRRIHSGIAAGLRSMEEVSTLVAAMEQDGKGVPILVRQYVKMRAVLLEFNVDRAFCDVVDGLVVVDLLRADPKMMERYMGTAGWELFCRWHAESGSSKLGFTGV